MSEQTYTGGQTFSFGRCQWCGDLVSIPGLFGHEIVHEFGEALERLSDHPETSE